MNLGIPFKETTSWMVFLGGHSTAEHQQDESLVADSPANARQQWFYGSEVVRVMDFATIHGTNSKPESVAASAP